MSSSAAPIPGNDRVRRPGVFQPRSHASTSTQTAGPRQWACKSSRPGGPEDPPMGAQPDSHGRESKGRPQVTGHRCPGGSSAVQRTLPQCKSQLRAADVVNFPSVCWGRCGGRVRRGGGCSHRAGTGCQAERGAGLKPRHPVSGPQEEKPFINLHKGPKHH